MLEERNKGRKAFLSYNKLVVIPELSRNKRPLSVSLQQHTKEQAGKDKHEKTQNNSNTQQVTKKNKVKTNIAQTGQSSSSMTNFLQKPKHDPPNTKIITHTGESEE